MSATADTSILELLGNDTRGFTLAYLRGSPDCVKLVNAAGRITFMSENGICAMEIGGLADVVGKTWWDMWPAQQTARVKSHFDQGMAGEVSRFQGTCPTAEGNDRDWDITVSPIKNDEGTVISVLAVSRDVTPVS
jgi:PAS domain S-box-containing protein